jgi:hypothetical protein
MKTLFHIKASRLFAAGLFALISIASVALADCGKIGLQASEGRGLSTAGRLQLELSKMLGALYAGAEALPLESVRPGQGTPPFEDNAGRDDGTSLPDSNVDSPVAKARVHPQARSINGGAGVVACGGDLRL